ncbi:MAG: PQQ-binding-like beta-propeller repeat protein [Planctomycetota bacterium]
MGKIHIGFWALLGALFISSTFGVALADWPQWRGPNRDGKSLDTGLLKKWPDGGPPLVWKADGIGAGFSSAAVADGMVYVTGVKGRDLGITAFNLEGEKQWEKPHGPAWTANYPGSRATPTIDDGKLYLMSGLGHLACYDAKSGERKWAVDVAKACNAQPPNWGYAESVLIYKDTAIVTPGGMNCIVAFKTATGKPAWRSKGLSDPPGYGSCILFEFKDVPMIANLTAKGLVCVDAKKGTFLWREDRCAGKTAVCPTPVYFDGYVFAASGYGNGGACVQLGGTGKRIKAKQAWETRDMVCHHGGYVVVDGYIYGNNENGWACIELKSGQTKWKEQGVGKGSICYADGMLYTYSENGGVIGLVEANPKRFNLVSQFRVQGQDKSWAHPAVTDGRLYLRYGDTLYVFDVKAK